MPLLVSDVEKGRSFWAFVPPKKSSPPAVKDAAWPMSDIDRYLLAKLEAKNLASLTGWEVADIEKKMNLKKTNAGSNKWYEDLWK